MNLRSVPVNKFVLDCLQARKHGALVVVLYYSILFLMCCFVCFNKSVLFVYLPACLFIGWSTYYQFMEFTSCLLYSVSAICVLVSSKRLQCNCSIFVIVHRQKIFQTLQ